MEQISCNTVLKIGLTKWRTAYLLNAEPIELAPEVYKGNLVCRQKDSSKHYSYKKLEKGLVKKLQIIPLELPF
jgi:hypothetical protein